VAGLEAPDEGEIWLGDRCVAGGTTFVPPERRQVGMVFQEYAVLPHLRARENVAFGLHGWPMEERRRRTQDALRLVGLEGLADRFPHQLSGGQQQRVALARALAPRPELVLLDEPFSNLDADRRQHLREEVRAILREVGATAVFVTHDQGEALQVGDRIAVMRAGRIEQIGTPDAVFLQPRNRFVAAFLGEAMFLPGVATDGGLDTELGLVRQPVELPAGTAVDVLVRPDDLALELDPLGAGVVEHRLFQGLTARFTVRLRDDRRLGCLTLHAAPLQPGDRVRVRLEPGHPLTYFPRLEAPHAPPPS
jgi:iron(III) transport system ATP-binding protein